MKESELIDKEEQKRQNARTFINAAQEMIESEGLENISVRKIAQKAGFHNSTIYLYFEDLDQLAMFASLKYFREYSHSLELQSQKNLSPTENFLSIWELRLLKHGIHKKFPYRQKILSRRQVLLAL